MNAHSPREALLAKVTTYFAEHGVGDTSLRSLAAGVGTSHRMLIYHFGSREGVLTAVIDAMARQQLEDMGTFLRAGEDADPREVAWATWEHLADDAAVFGPLLFELSAHAMVGHEWAAQLRELISDGVRRLALFFEALGEPAERAALLARTSMAIARGALFDLALTGDRDAADEVIRNFNHWIFDGE
ncbi:TetR/AcrR family transcriptional regulator [Nocardioides sp. TF02-7]|uniref:TetR/AcrR family transcriptional regulator n=1 Tax=Nocardioides sp. TF02-7 TaxID=2917724 RepID=UPI001F063698|nr:TetR/AcrR family transcriptional regulator [Nocardioides sp. TF02-7]UMG94118.1 TetR/AcrR family transcriptional regulator [Nocardioides sp. TF02-7]